MMVGANSAGRTAVDVVFLVAIVSFLCWRFFTPNGHAFGVTAMERRKARQPKPISSVGEKTAAGLACPKCGGTQFKTGRKTSTKLTFGASSMLGQAHFVRCVTCGTRYRRG